MFVGGNVMVVFQAAAAAQLLVQRRVLTASTALLAVAIILWVVAIFTDHWLELRPAGGSPTDLSLLWTFGQSESAVADKTNFVSGHSGLWRVCVITRGNETEVCRYRDIFRSKKKASTKAELQQLSYSRTLVTFCVVSLGLILMGFLAAIYTFREPRYTFKRLAAGIQLLALSSMLVVVQVVSSAAEFEQSHLPQWCPPGATIHAGPILVVGWCVLGMHLFAATAFLVYSRKRKGRKAPNDDLALADEPTIIGR